MECGIQMQVNQFIPRLRAHRQEEIVARDAGVVNEDVHALELVLDGLEQRADLLGLGHVALDDAHRAARFDRQRGGFRGLVGGAFGFVVDDDRGPATRQFHGDRPAQAAQRAGHDGHAAVQILGARLRITHKRLRVDRAGERESRGFVKRRSGPSPPSCPSTPSTRSPVASGGLRRTRSRSTRPAPTSKNRRQPR